MVDGTGFDTKATWNSGSGPIVSGLPTSRTPNPFEYTTLSWYTTATATPGTPVWSTARCTMLSSWPTAVSTFVWPHRGGTGRTGVGMSSPGAAVIDGAAVDERGVMDARALVRSRLAAPTAATTGPHARWPSRCASFRLDLRTTVLLDEQRPAAPGRRAQRRTVPRPGGGGRRRPRTSSSGGKPRQD